VQFVSVALPRVDFRAAQAAPTFWGFGVVDFVNAELARGFGAGWDILFYVGDGAASGDSLYGVGEGDFASGD
jgi:hypothetical protein